MAKANALETKNKMGYMPITKLIITMSLPVMASMLIQALYNIVDSMYVNRLSTQAFDALSIAFPVQQLMMGIAMGTAVGANALIARNLGAGDRKKANNIAMHGVMLSLFAYILSLLFGVFGIGAFFRLYANKVTSETIAYGTTYLRIICLFSFGTYLHVVFERIMQSTGRTIYTLYTQGIGAVLNIILDPIMIFGYLGFPALGVAGAAYATVISQIVSAIISIVMNHKFNHDLDMKLSNFKFDIRAVGNIYAIGVPSMIMMGIGSVMNFFMNQILGGLTQTGITIFGAYFRIQSFIFMPVFGMNNAIIPIVSFNYGAQNRARMLKAIKTGLLFAAIIMLVGLVIMQVFPDKILKIFETNTSPANLYEVGIPAFRIISLCFIFAAFCIIMGSVFQALGRSVFSMLVSIARQIIILVPVAYILSLSGNIDLVWWSFPAAELASLIATLFFYIRMYKTQIATLPDAPPEILE